MMNDNNRVVVIGLGYVGLPLAIALARNCECWGIDIDRARIAELGECHDRTGEVDPDQLRQSTLHLTANAHDCPPADFYIVTVPTPIDAERRPDLSLLERASTMVGSMIDASRQPIIIFESTVYPGVTEGLCAQTLEQASGLRCGVDFFLGYSPERINPGDREHTISKITKVVSGQNDQVLDKVAALYEGVTSGGVFRASSIMTAEAAKVIENAQRDINIAFMNEITQIFRRMDISIWDVLAAAGTKWNFLPFTPGLVGGHCIGVDPYYLSHRASELGHDPRVILAGRAINDQMAHWLAEQIDQIAGGKAKSILMLGLSFKENVPDIRNSKVFDVISALADRGHQVTAHDQIAHVAEIEQEYGIAAQTGEVSGCFDMVVLATPHNQYMALDADQWDALLAPGGTLVDVKRAIAADRRPRSARYWHF